MLNALKNLIGRFGRNDSGGLSILVAFLLVPLLLMAGAAIDYSRALKTKTTIMNSLDAAVIAGTSKMVREGASKAEVEAIIKATFEASTGGLDASGSELKSLSVYQNPSTGEVKVDATVGVPATFMQLAGFETMDVDVSSAAKLTDKDIELAMMLDVTGSMGGSKIKDLKLAAKDLVDILIPPGGKTSSNTVRIGLVPYSQGVNAGPYASIATNGESASCATERNGGQAQTDASYKKKAIGNGSTGCPNVQILPLSDSNSELTTRINSFSTTGWTAGHTGISWAWYMLSPKWGALWPSDSVPVPYGTKDTVKIAILMTDGEFNTAYKYNKNKKKYDELKGNAKTKSEKRAKKLCTNMKKKNIQIYSIAFQLYSASGKALMQECATNSSNYYDATDGDALRNAFRNIAEDISKLRISQ